MGARTLVVLQASAALSLSARVRAVEEAVYRRNDQLIDRGDSWWPQEVGEADVLARRGQKTYRVPYTLTDEGLVTFGDPVEVEAQYVAVEASVAFTVSGRALELAAAEAESEDPSGLVWEVDVIRAGMSTSAVTLPDGRTLPVFFTDEYVRALVPMLADAPVYALDDTASGHKPAATEKLQEQSVGWTASPRYHAGVVSATLHFDDANPLALQKAKQLVSAWQRGNPRRFGLSIDSRGIGEVRRHAGRETYFATEPGELLSTDIVLRPAAGGGFTKLVASRGPHHTEEEMNRDRLIAAIRASRPQALQDKDLTTITMAELLTLANEAELRAAWSAEPAQPAPAPAVSAQASAVDVTAIAAQVTTQVTAALTARQAMESVIAASQLPARTQASLRRELDRPGATLETVQAAVDERRQELAEAAGAHVAGLGGPALQGAGGAAAGLQVFAGVDPLDKVQAAVDRAFGLEPLQSELKTIQPLGLLAAYTLVTCGQDSGVQGGLGAREFRVIQAAGFDESTLPTVMENTLNRRLAADYAEISYGDEFLVSAEGTLRDFRPQTTARLGYLGTFGTVNTDTQEYPVVNAYGEERAIYEPDERGMIVEITRRHILNDDLDAVARIPGRIARAGRRTVAEFIFSFLVSNPVIPLTPGTLTWFHATRNNLLTDALSVAGLNNARLQLANQVEPDSNKRLGLSRDVKLHLWVPTELYDTARAINQSELIPGSANNDANPWHHAFGPNNERIHEVYTLLDANDWALSVDPKERDLIEIKYLNGNKVPQIVRQDAPGVGKVFTQGKIAMKAYFDFGGTPIDFRGIVKSVVAA